MDETILHVSEKELTLVNELFECRGMNANLLADGRFALSGSSPHYAPDRVLDALHITLDLALDFPRKALSGKVTTTLAALTDQATSVLFDAVDFKTIRVFSKQRLLKHTYDGRKLHISWQKPLVRG